MKRRGLLLVLVGLAFACGKTVFTNERFACSTSGECADGSVCRDGECRRGEGEEDGGEDEDAGSDAGADAGPRDGGADAGRGDGGPGTACTATSGCEAGLTCVDAVCCRSACSAPCDSCNQAGSTGTCLPRPAGSSAASCSGYACDGIGTGCASTCSADAGVNACNPGFTCFAPTCGRCWSGVTNAFSQTNDPAWLLSSATIAGGHLTIPVMSRNGMSSLTEATSTDTLPLAGCGVTFELVVPPVVVAGYVGRAGLRADNVQLRPAFGWQFDTRGLLATWTFSDGGVSEQVLVPAGTAPPRWLRLEEAGGQVRWRSTNATSFTTLHTVAHGESLTGLKLEFSGAFPPQGGNDRVSFEVDSLNLGP